jgi:hypothetical protein
MSDPHVLEDLLAYVSGNLDHEASEAVKEHLTSCDTCRHEYESLRTFWETLDASPDEMPVSSLGPAFRDMLSAYERDAKRTGWTRSSLKPERLLGRILYGHPALQFGLAAAFLLVGFLLGLALKSGNGANNDIAQLRKEVGQLRTLVAVSLLQQESASERLKGVSWSSRLYEANPDIRNALFNTMKYDHNVNVRLAALEALSHDIGNATVRQEIIRALPDEKSPLMQLALADILVQINDSEARQALEQALGRSDLHPDVRKRIKQGIQLIL